MLTVFSKCWQFSRNADSFLEMLTVFSPKVGWIWKGFHPCQIQPTLGEWRPASRKSRREQVVISRLRIGHIRLTHSFILKQEPQPQCLTCQTTCTVKHILIEWWTFTGIRKRFFKVNSLTDLFENVKIDDILSFLRETVVPKNMTTLNWLILCKQMKSC